MKVLVTGGAGYIGSITVERLLDSGHDVDVFDNFENGHRAALDARAGCYEGDFRDPDAIHAAVKASAPDAVVHFAAYALVPESMQHPGLYFRNNVMGTMNLLDAMVAEGVKRIVFSSTCATYGDPDQVPITESEKQKPTNPYGESKLMVEQMLRWYGECHGVEATMLRYFNACGATAVRGEDHDPETHLIPLILQVALGQREFISIFGDDYETPDGTCIRDYIHIVDLADAHILALTGGHTGAFNLGNGEGHSVAQVVETVREVTGHPIPARNEPRRAGDPPRLVADASRAREVLGWDPKHADLRDIIESAWAWHQAHPKGYAD